MKRTHWRAVGLLGLAVLGGCATSPFAPSIVHDESLRVAPATVVTRPSMYVGRPVLWGGRIIGSQNLSASTELTVLAYPLDSMGEPRLGRPALGRFVIREGGYLETMDFAPGRLVSVYGRIAGVRTGHVGERPYVYPVVQAHRLYLWPVDRPKPAVRFGVGIGIGVH
ncbi:MAG: Slp family lipoprotein [Betaproteobacteria bacterium]|nr:Slp family lipoprotein [Betaproteobacteria bacterium]